MLPNPIKEMLELRVGLRLSDEQEAKLNLISDSLAAANTVTGKAIQAEIAKMGASPDAGRMMAVVRPGLEEMRKHLQAALDSARAVLNAEQWNYLPDRIKSPRTLVAPGRGERRRPPGE
jgi:plasmid stabilization system protein ParE